MNTCLITYLCPNFFSIGTYEESIAMGITVLAATGYFCYQMQKGQLVL